MKELERLTKKKWFWIIIAIIVIPFLAYLVENILGYFYFGFYPERSKPILTVYYLMLTLIATSAIGYFAFKANTMQFYLKRKSEAFIKISKEVMEQKKDVNDTIFIEKLNLWNEKIEGGIDQKIEIFIKLLKSYKEEYMYMINELSSRIDQLLPNLYELKRFYTNTQYEEYNKNFWIKHKEFDSLINIFLDDIKAILYDGN